jgi:hypothetical protein
MKIKIKKNNKDQIFQTRKMDAGVVTCNGN